MGSAGIIGFSSIGDVNQPSPSIFADCPNTLLQDKGLGYFSHEDFLGVQTGTYVAATDAIVPNYNGLNLSTSDSVVISRLAGKLGGFLKLVTPATDNTAFALFSAPIGTITKNSGNKVWFECGFQLNELADVGLFLGLADETAADKDVVVNDPSNAAAAATKASQSAIGFISAQASSALASFNVISKKTTTAVVTVASDVTNSSAIASAGGTIAAPAATTPIKLGLRFDGLHTVTFYVNGYKAALLTVDATVDQASKLAACVGFKTGSAAAKGIAIDFIRYGAQTRS